MIYFISGFIIVLTSSLTFAEYTFNCDDYEKPIILETHFCRITTYDSKDREALLATLPHPTESDNFRSAEILTITPPTNNFSFLIKNNTNLHNLFPAVKALTISNFQSVIFADDGHELAKWLFDLPALDNFTFTDANLNGEQHHWLLPEKLQHLNFSGNNYNDYDVKNLKYLKVVDFSRNNLTRIPSMAYPLYTLTELDLSYNPLSNVTTEDVAKLCTLEKLNLTKTSFSSSFAERYCECKKLRRWARLIQEWTKNQHYKEFSVILDDCTLPVIDTKCKKTLGEKFSLKEAYRLREYCLTGKNFTIGEENLSLDEDDDEHSQKNDDSKKTRSS